MKATNIFKDKNFIECLKNNTFDEKGKHIKIFNNNDEIIEENLNKVIKIDCSLCWITNIVGISIFKNLKSIDLIYNQIEKLPSEIGKLQNLEELFLSYNEIKKLPSEIGKLKNLKKLNLSDNKIEKLPKEIGELKKLKRLYLSYNNLQSLPKEIWNLENLEELYSRDNKIQEIPKEIFQLKNLKELDFSYNKIEKLPKEIGNLKNLKELNLWYNQLQGLPKEILKLNKLKEIWLHKAFDFNNFKQDPEELRDILEQLKGKNLFSNRSLEYLKEEVYPILKEKIKEKYWITNLKNFKDNLNFDNLNF